MQAWPKAWGGRWAIGVLRPKRVAILEAVAIGLIAALAAVLLTDGIGRLGGWRVAMARTSGWPPWLVLPLVGNRWRRFGGGGGAGIGAGKGAGSGIPQVKAAL
ncbi:MAG: hypothetical protein HC918_12755, partial [Oscillatoriales cyanobacterium SM2_1_8]|nr:hypothetical protein [Oscillatoriales cyanobacterium SM2_1_8]